MCDFTVDNYHLFVDIFAGDQDFNSYICQMRRKNEWASDQIIYATCLYLRKNIYTLAKENSSDRPLNDHYQIDPKNATNLSQCLILGYYSQVHFQSLMPLTEKQTKMQKLQSNTTDRQSIEEEFSVKRVGFSYLIF